MKNISTLRKVRNKQSKVNEFTNEQLRQIAIREIPILSAPIMYYKIQRNDILEAIQDYNTYFPGKENKELVIAGHATREGINLHFSMYDTAQLSEYEGYYIQLTKGETLEDLELIRFVADMITSTQYGEYESTFLIDIIQ